MTFLKFTMLSLCLATCVPAWSATQVITESAHEPKLNLVEITTINPRIQLDLVWATGNNHLNLILYPDGTRCCLQKKAAYALDKVQKELEEMGCGLKVLEAFRPRWAQEKLWKVINFTPTNPNQGRHTTGLAVDLTIIDLKSGKELAMPPYIYDDMTVTTPTVLTKEQQHNSDLLKNLMTKHGFAPLESEWFHFDYQK
ncbi:MAG TPA: M15 family metallopeptidase [Candidatus Limnocylindria bacterium]|nr:M15 family metallopeptidase [Candidatus Limnocylindria bacterium]